MMSHPPIGTATFLFTDIEGSTALWQAHRVAMAEALALHDSLIRSAIEARRGHVFKTVGDQVCAMFPTAPDALAAALAAQRAVRAADWQVPGGLRVRMALHAGDAQERGGDYFGPTLNRLSRILAAARGGQILLSQAARELVLDQLPPGADLREIGERHLKDLERPERLFELVSPDLPAPTEPAPPSRTMASRLRSSAGAVTGISVAVLVMALAALLFVRREQAREAPAPDAAGLGEGASIAVLPFTVRGEGLDVWREGMVDLLSINLEGVPGLRAIDSRTVLARWRERTADNESPDLQTALETARSTGARYALLGSVVATGPRLRLAADIYDLESGRSFDPGAVEGSVDSVMALVDHLSVEVLRTLLGGDGERSTSVSLARATTASLPALKAFLEGEVHFRRSDFGRAISAYERAVEADSTFALALYRLATAHGWEEIVATGADRAYLERAARHAGRLSARDALLVQAKLALLRGTLDGWVPLQQAVRRHPDDAEAWYLLGETSFHLGRQALAGQQENDMAFARSLELDPNFTPAYIHLIENAFNYHADSARAAQLVEAYARRAAGSESSRLNGIALALGFGDAEARARAHAALDSLSAQALLSVALHLWHPRFAAEQERVLLAARQRGGPQAADATLLLYLNGFLRGKLDAALGYVDDPLMIAGYREAALYAPYMTRLSGLLEAPLTDSERLDEELTLGESDSFPYLKTFYAGAYAADRERWSDHARAVERLRKAAEDELERGDSTSARFTEGMALALRGHLLARQGREAEAVPVLIAAQRQATAWAPLEVLNATIRFWIQRLHMKAGDVRAAERYAASFWQDPLAAFSLGRVYEELEQDEKARAAFGFFIEAWSDADPDLQPLVEEARRAVGRLPR